MAANKKPRPQKKGQPDWMASYSDMMSLLFCLFVLLYAMSNVDQAKFEDFARALSGGRVSIISGGDGVLNDGQNGILDNPSAIPNETDDKTGQGGEEGGEKDGGDDPLGEEISKRKQEMTAIAESFKTYMAQHDPSAGEGVSVSVDQYGEYVRITLPGSLLFDSGRAAVKPAAMSALDAIAAEMLKFVGHEIYVEGHTDNVPQNSVQYPSNYYLSAARAIAVMEYLERQGLDPKMLSALGRGEYWPVDTNDTAEGRANNRRVEILIYAKQTELQQELQQYSQVGREITITID
jgi:chemotaxis protein MotB